MGDLMKESEIKEKYTIAGYTTIEPEEVQIPVDVTGLEIDVSSGEIPLEEAKELLILQVEKYNGAKSNINKGMVLDVVCLFITCVGIATINLVRHSELPVIYSNIVNLFLGGYGYANLRSLIQKISDKAKINVNVEDIRHWFQHHGLNLEGELENSKGRGR